MNVKQRLDRLEKSIGWGTGCRMIGIKYNNTAEDKQRALDFIDELEKHVKVIVIYDIPNNHREPILKENEEMLRVVIEN